MSTVLAHTDLVFYDILKKTKPSDNLYQLRTNTDDSVYFKMRTIYKSIMFGI